MPLKPAPSFVCKNFVEEVHNVHVVHAAGGKAEIHVGHEPAEHALESLQAENVQVQDIEISI